MDFKFCPYCKKRLRENKNFYKCPSCQRTIYKHSSLTASFYPVKRGKVLLAKRAIEPQKGAWDALGGFLNYGEHPEKGALREVKEETNLSVKIEKLLGVYLDKYQYQNRVFKTLNFFYVGKIVKGRIKVKDDVNKVRWFLIKKTPKKLAFKCIRESLKDLQKWYNSKS